MHDQATVGLANRGQNSFPVPWRQCPQINDLAGSAAGFHRSLAALDHGPPGDQRDVFAWEGDLGPPKGQGVVVAGIGTSSPGSVEHRPMLKEHDRIVAAKRRAQQADRVLGV